MRAGFQQSVQQQLQWIKASSQLSDRAVHNNPVEQVKHYIEQGETLAATLSSPQREQHLLRMLTGLIDCATDPLTPDLLKQLCLDNLYRPSGRLRTLFQNDPQRLRELDRIHRSLNTLYNHCSHRC